jgi:hypothetical protein
MRKKQKLLWTLLFLFGLIFIIKSNFLLLRERPIIFSDEPCIIRMAMYLAENFKLASCQEITQLPAVSPLPLYSILIAPLFLFFKNNAAYTAILLFNAFLSSTLVYPLYKILREFTSKHKYILFSIVTILFSTQITSYESLALTENLFIVLNIWLLHFYIKYLNKEGKKNLLISITLGIAATLTRPFGFISLVALGINEVLRRKIDKKRRRKMFILIALFAVSLLIIILFKYLPTENYVNKIQSLKSLSNWVKIIQALIDQAFSFIIAIFFIPILLIANRFKNNNESVERFKFFIISIVILIGLISSQHVFGYLIGNQAGNPNTGGITRYINLPLILLLIYCLGTLADLEKFKLDKQSKIIIAISFIILLTHKFETLKYSLNVDIGVITNKLAANSNAIDSSLLSYPAITILLTCTLALTILLIKNRIKETKILFGIFVIVLGINSYIEIHSVSKNHPLATYFSSEEEENVTFILDDYETLDFEALWLLLSLTNNNIQLIVMNPPSELSKDLKIENIGGMKELESYKNAHYILTEYQSDLNLESIFKKSINIYKAVQ